MKAKWYAKKKVLFLVISLFFVAVATGYIAIKEVFFNKPQTTKYVAEDGTVFERTNILLLGIDARPGDTKSRTDTMILLSIDPKKNSVAVLSIPRDTMVELPEIGYEKINAANVYGGIEMTQKAVQDLLGVPVHYYVMTNFDGFRDIIDTLGGVTLNVEKDMVYRKEGIRLAKGEQKLDGDKALQYVRFRSDAMGDIGRTQRQQNFIKAITNEMLTLKTITKLPKLVPQISNVVTTNMTLTEMVKMANWAKKMERDHLVSQTLPGNFYDYRGISYWKVDETKIKQFVQSLFTNGQTTGVIDESVAQETPTEDKNNYSKPTPRQGRNSSKNTGTGGAGTGSSRTGNTDSGSTGTGSTDTGSTDSGSTGTGSTGTGNTDSGSTGTGSTGTGNTDSGSTGTGSSDTGDTGAGGADTGSPGTGDTGTGTGSNGTGSTESKVEG